VRVRKGFYTEGVLSEQPHLLPKFIFTFAIISSKNKKNNMINSWRHFSRFIPFFAFLGLCFSCKTPARTIIGATTEIPVPTRHSGEPNLFAINDRVYMSWIENLKDTTHAMVFSTLKDGQWTQPITIAQGKNWFVNWADFPSLAVFGDGKTMVAHWLQKSAKGTYDYDIQVAQSFDAGKTWSPPFLLNRDGVQAEHGFVSFEPLPNGTMFATWLDGRKTKTGHEQAKDHEHNGSMTLRSAIIDAKGRLSEEMELDEKICDCCQTAAAVTNKGVLVAYRNRSEEEIRDIYVMRAIKGQWLMPKPVFADNWKINGCPVNGPAISANGNAVALAWFTAAEGNAQVKLAFSKNAGANFGKPIRIDAGKPIGRVDVHLLDKSKAVVSWMEENEGNGDVKMVVVDVNGNKTNEQVLATTGKNRRSGFPRIAKVGNTLVVAWTDVIGEKTTIVKTKQLVFSDK
jgi:hypothetical protein